ncbi:hypothetical protein D9619_012182 [Psilocybe cf. subviscida]|uniref:Uncharacterized protein n=1 Tax=Psilocybe cf. subviscida TaxID=2480587 RepID=A0A8H5B7H7_9AGAR|nr:hypothetical protein D9619_012182 [Psilocybe cf. subviscida]
MPYRPVDSDWEIGNLILLPSFDGGVAFSIYLTTYTTRGQFHYRPSFLRTPAADESEVVSYTYVCQGWDWQRMWYGAPQRLDATGRGKTRQSIRNTAHGPDGHPCRWDARPAGRPPSCMKKGYIVSSMDQWINEDYFYVYVEVGDPGRMVSGLDKLSQASTLKMRLSICN